VMGFKDENPEVYQNIMSGIGQCAESAARAIKLGQWDLLGEIFNAQQALMTELLVSDDNLNEIIEQLRQIPTVYGAKISGAGMGDCIVALGEVPTHSFPRTEKQKLLGVKQIYVQVCEQGVMVHV
jgi:mevalonate kinase